MSAKTIEVVVAADGTLKIDAVGFAGPDCEKATAFLEAALGLRTGRTKKPEYHARRTAQQQVRA
jgi:hypothetical protein